jgi:hypothetical protein
MKLKPSEVKLTGQLRMEDGHLVNDPLSDRIRELARDYLQLIGRDESGWDTLYRDPLDGRLWELIYPESGLQGGGPPELRHLTDDEARAKYTNLSIFSN